MYDVVTIGSALIDTFIKSDQFHIQKGADGGFLCQRYGDKVDVDDFVVCTGGGGSNTAVGFSRLGFSTAVIAETGKDVLSKVVVDDLVTEHVSTSWMISQENESTGGSVILVGKDGGRTVLVHRGAASCLDPHDIPEHILKNSDWVHISSISGQKETLKKIFSILTKHNVRSSWNPGKAEIQALLDGFVSVQDISSQILFVNSYEWELLQNIQNDLLNKIKVIVVTDGAKGGVVFQLGQEFLEYGTNAIPVVDETGAGDAFCTGFAAAVIKNHDLETACSWGIKNSESVIGYFGAKKGLLDGASISSPHR